MNKRSVGSEKETRAARYLEEAGMRILARNFRCRQGEIDLVAADGNVIVFVEVKYRKMPEQVFRKRPLPRVRCRGFPEQQNFSMQDISFRRTRSAALMSSPSKEIRCGTIGMRFRLWDK